MKKNFLIVLPLAALLALPAVAQQQQSTGQTTGTTDTQQHSTGQITTGEPEAQQTVTKTQTGEATTTTQANVERQPLETEQHEGFWGKINPFARKKYVKRQVEPIRNRVNELDELTANNAKAIKDVDARATEGIRQAHSKATEADQRAMQAGQKAQSASQTAQQASARLQTVEQVVGNLDDYKAANQTEIRYRAGTTTLSKNAKQALDDMAGNIQGQRGYIVQIQGFAPGRGQAAIQNSQTMAQSVARYLVLQHQVPNYRIFVVGMGNTPTQTAEGKSERVRAGRVEVTLMKNGVDQLAQNSPSASLPNQSGMTGSTQPASEPANSQPPAGSVASPQRPEPPQMQTQPTPPQTH